MRFFDGELFTNKNDFELKVTILMHQDELDVAKREAEVEAFRFISQKIGVSTNLETIDQIKQTVQIKHSKKISFLRARVQGVVSNIEVGINNLKKSSKDLHNVSYDNNSIEKESKTVIGHIGDLGQFKTMQALAIIWERSTLIDELIGDFNETDKTMESISNYMKKNPNSIPIKLLLTVESLISFESELIDNLESSELKKYVEFHFKEMHECKKRVIQNAYDTIENAFVHEIDSIIRANWILISIGQHDKIIECIRTAITQEFYAKMESKDRNNIVLYLNTLNELIENLPEQLELLIPALPADIDALELITSFSNTEIFKILTNYRDSMPQTASLIDAMIKCMKDIECTLRALLGESPSNDFLGLMMELQSSFEKILYDDYQKFLNNIINLDESSVATRRDGIYFTPAPKDMIDRLLDAYNFAKSSSLDIASVIRENLIEILAKSFESLGNNAMSTGKTKYIMGMTNNSQDAVKCVTDFKKSNPHLILKEDFATLTKPWVEIRKKGLLALSENIFVRSVGSDEEFRVNFHDILDNITDSLEDMSNHLYQPLYKKLLGIVSHEFIPHYIQSFLMKPIMPKPQDQEEFESVIFQECNTLSSLFNSLEPNLCRNSMETIEAFRDFMSDDYDNLHDLFHIIAKEYSDFTPSLAIALVKKRLDNKNADLKEVSDAFEMMYKNIDTSRNDHFFNQDLAKKSFLK
ncbi:hypothetical protein TRFO_07461 [Tritrichomonas foetus]|uniref:Uncharacterized protein n=1 Tax=Tritrichomonas foetus TaxID=1144522 RepID=A0A1J4JVM2_9EUKA|nr:hypothetical protein TRFO_07461 [Tritrichomonas foetus]|eukprot:OHT01582.1 hypothetical protein TRFO_07461 [Tritrichomonas foetus]